MDFMNKMERRFGRYAIRNLSLIMVAVYAAGYLIELVYPQLLLYLTLSPGLILRGQVWRLITWVLVPPGSFDILTIVMLYFYFSIGQTLERTWGAFRFNVYIFSGVIFTLIGAFALYLAGGVTGYFSTYYINMSILLAFAATYPDIQVYLYFLIPLKMKYLGIVYGFFMVLAVVQGGWADRVSIIASLLNFIIYYLMTRDLYRYSPHEVRRRREFRKNVKKVQPRGNTLHKCAVCGRTEKDGAHLEFRYCSKCDGNYEYCQDHLFSHQHIRAGGKQ